MSDYLERLAAARGLETKFLGSGITTAAAKKRFTAARKPLQGRTSGRAGQDNLGLDARLRRANTYLTKRTNRAKMAPADRELDLIFSQAKKAKTSTQVVAAFKRLERTPGGSAVGGRRALDALKTAGERVLKTGSAADITNLVRAIGPDRADTYFTHSALKKAARTLGVPAKAITSGTTQTELSTMVIERVFGGRA